MSLSIIIVNWNVRPLLEECLRSIFQNAPSFDFEVFVVDNASRDGSVDFLKKIAKNKKNLHIILNKKNLGFAKANNQAIDKAKGDYILFLNPDTKIMDNALEKITERLEKHKNWGICGCKLINIEGDLDPSVRPFPTPFSQAAILLKLHHLFPFLKIWKHYFGLDFDYSREGPADQIKGAFLMTRKKIIEEVGKFDEKFYLWFEEIDFCYRVKKAGWENYYTPKAKILHYGGQSFSQIFPLAKQKIYNQSLLYYARKYFSPSSYYFLKSINPITLLLSWLWQQFSNICVLWRKKNF